MIRQETARAIYNCYSEIINTEKLLAEIETIEKRIEDERKEAFHRDDITERYEIYELGVPSSFGSERNRSMRLFHVKPSMAKAVITAHQASQKSLLVELNQKAKLELESEETDVTKEN